MTRNYDPNSNVTAIWENEVAGPGSSGSSELYGTTFEYDELNQRIATHIRGLNGNSIDHRWTISYDSRRNAVLMQDAENRFVLNTYDDQNRIVLAQRFTGNPFTGAVQLQRVEAQFDKNNRKIAEIAYSSATNPATAQVTSYFYDHADRRFREVYPDSTDVDDAVQIIYDANGNTVSVREQRGVVFTNLFDAANRLIHQNMILPAGVPGTTRQSYAYDALSRLTNAANNYAQVVREYDALSRQTAELQSIRLEAPALPPDGSNLCAWHVLSTNNPTTGDASSPREQTLTWPSRAPSTH